MRKAFHVAALACLGAAFGFMATAQQKTNKRAETNPAAPAVVVTVPAKNKKDEAAHAKKTENEVRYAYEFTQPQFNPHLIRIEHDAAGRGKISFERRDDTEPLVESLEISPAALERIKAEWDALNFLDSETNYQTEQQFPHLGTMRLRMTAGQRDRIAEFNWTHDPHASALVSEYRRLGDQQLFIFEIDLARQYQPSESVKLIKRLEALVERKGLSDAAQMLPLLRELSTDERLPLIARNHVGRLLKKLEPGQ
ncbi:hypothetical protein BH18ACI2_BH18ACI2_01170 [soil metagenome]